MTDILCNSCFHKDVCSYKEAFYVASKKYEDSNFLSVNVACNFFCEGDETERANYIRELELEKEGLYKEIARLQDVVLQSGDVVKELREERASMIIAKAAITTDRDKAYDDVSKLQTENDELYSVNAELRDKVRELKEGVERLTSQRDTLMKELEAMYERQKNDIQTAMTEDAARIRSFVVTDCDGNAVITP